MLLISEEIILYKPKMTKMATKVAREQIFQKAHVRAHGFTRSLIRTNHF